MELDFSQRVVAPSDVLVRVLDGEAVVLDLESESYYGLDDVGTRMWTLLTESSSIQVAYEALIDEYEVEPARLRVDLTELLQKLREHDLVMVENGQAD